MSDIPPVLSAEINSIRAFQKKSPNLYVDIRLDGSAMQHTSVIKGDTAPFWNERFHMYVQLSA
jgi:hypothetical protein